MKEPEFKPILAIIITVFLLFFLSNRCYRGFNGQFIDLLDEEAFVIDVESEFQMNGGIYINDQYIVSFLYNDVYSYSLSSVIDKGMVLEKTINNDTMYVKENGNVTHWFILAYGD